MAIAKQERGSSRARRTRTRRHAVRKRGFEDEGKAPCCLAARAAPGPKGRRSVRRLFAADRGDRRSRARLRRDPFPCGLAAAAGPAPDRRAVSDDHAQAARPSGPGRRGRRFSGGSFRLHLRQSAAAATGRELGRYDSPWTAEGLFRASFESGSYLVFLGRLTAEKGPEATIRIARAVGMPLRIAARFPRAASLPSGTTFQKIHSEMISCARMTISSCDNSRSSRSR